MGSARRSVAVILAAGACLSASISLAASPSSAASRLPPATYVTFLFGRAQYQVVRTCQPVVPIPDTKSLNDVKRLFAAKGWVASPNVVVDYAEREACARGRAQYATWEQLDQLTDSPAAWQPVSAGKYYRPLAQLTASQVRDEACGSLPLLAAQGYTRAWALYAYPAGKYLYNGGKGTSSSNAQADVVHNCFAYGRRYGTGINVRTALHAPWLVSAQSPIGGTAAVNHGTYRVPSQVIANNVVPGAKPGQWLVLQFYRFRSGYQAGDHNCVGPANTHFTKFNEEYCWEDFLTIVKAIPSTAVVTDPATVACAWGRFPDSGSRPSCQPAEATVGRD